MRTTDGVADGASFSSIIFSSTAKALRTRAALADYLNSPAGTGLEPAAPAAALASTGEIQSRLAARAGLLLLFDAYDADGCASSSACLAALGQGGPA
jgi:hypothetical protein